MIEKGTDPHARQKTDTDEMAAFRQRLATDDAKRLYKQRPSIAEFPNARMPPPRPAPVPSPRPETGEGHHTLVRTDLQFDAPAEPRLGHLTCQVPHDTPPQAIPTSTFDQAHPGAIPDAPRPSDSTAQVPHDPKFPPRETRSTTDKQKTHALSAPNKSQWATAVPFADESFLYSRNHGPRRETLALKSGYMRIELSDFAMDSRLCRVCRWNRLVLMG